MENTQTRKEELQGFIDSREKQKEEGVSLAAQGVINSEIEAFKSELSAIEEAEQNEAAQQVRIQAQEESIQSYVDVAAQMFEALFPQEVYESILGLTEYNEKRQQFYQLNHAYYSERVQGIYDNHNNEVAAKDENIKSLNDQLAQSKEDIDNIAKRNESLNTQVDELTKTVDELQGNLTESKVAHQEAIDLLNTTKTKLNESESKVSEIQQELDQEKKAKESAKPSQNLQSMMDSFREKNTSTIKTAAQIALETATPHRGKVEVTVPTVEQVLPFPDNTQVDQTNVEPSTDAAPIAIPEIPEVTEGAAQFPTNEGTVQPEVQVADRNETASVAGTTVSRQEHEALKARVDSIEKKINVQQVA